MLATILLDTYEAAAARDVAAALEDVCSPTDCYGWSSAGVYSFWNPATHDCLYIGRAVDLRVRFEQHNGIRGANAGKGALIEEHFRQHEVMGYSIIVQSPLAQPLSSRAIRGLSTEAIAAASGAAEGGAENVRRVEGTLIRAHRDIHDALPPWNKILGEVPEGLDKMSGNAELLDLIAARRWGDLVARATLREVSANPTFATYEEYLHAARLAMLVNGCSFSDALGQLPDDAGVRTRLSGEGYLTRRPKIQIERRQ